MGLEMWYQAIPPDCELVELARADLEISEGLSLIPGWFSREVNRPAPGQEGKQKDRLWDWCCRLAGQCPDLHERKCYLDRWWDILHYLLSATRRGESPSTTDLAVDRAFNAGEVISEQARGGQGIPVRYLPPLAIREIGGVLGLMGSDDLAVHYDPERMEAAGVYKFWADRADTAEWEWIVQYFNEFREFFLAAATAGNAAIVVKD